MTALVLRQWQVYWQKLSALTSTEASSKHLFQTHSWADKCVFQVFLRDCEKKFHCHHCTGATTLMRDRFSTGKMSNTYRDLNYSHQPSSAAQDRLLTSSTSRPKTNWPACAVMVGGVRMETVSLELAPVCIYTQDFDFRLPQSNKLLSQGDLRINDTGRWVCLASLLLITSAADVVCYLTALCTSSRCQPYQRGRTQTLNTWRGCRPRPLRAATRANKGTVSTVICSRRSRARKDADLHATERAVAGIVEESTPAAEMFISNKIYWSMAVSKEHLQYLLVKHWWTPI